GTPVRLHGCRGPAMRRVTPLLPLTRHALARITSSLLCGLRACTKVSLESPCSPPTSTAPNTPACRCSNWKDESAKSGRSREPEKPRNDLLPTCHPEAPVRRARFFCGGGVGRGVLLPQIFLRPQAEPQS